MLSVVVPAYNEETRLVGTLTELMAHLDASSVKYEVIVVDDGSSDGTAAVVQRLSAAFPRLSLIDAEHHGKGHAVRTGVLAARGSRIVFCDADLPVPPADVMRVAECLQDCPIVVGSREGPRATRLGEPHLRHFMGRVFNAVVRAVAVPGIQDTQCGVKGFTAESARAVFSRQTIDGFGFDVEVLYIAKRCGYEIAEVPVTWSYRALSRVDPVADSLRMLRDVVRVRLQDLRGRYDWPALARPTSVASAARTAAGGAER
jgi:glycosyltransferase involved in cell wall biosynthesis